MNPPKAAKKKSCFEHVYCNPIKNKDFTVLAVQIRRGTKWAKQFSKEPLFQAFCFEKWNNLKVRKSFNSSLFYVLAGIDVDSIEENLQSELEECGVLQDTLLGLYFHVGIISEVDLKQPIRKQHFEFWLNF